MESSDSNITADSDHGLGWQPENGYRESDLETIQKLYPEDEATGFEMGELGEVWSVQFPPDHFNEQDE